MLWKKPIYISWNEFQQHLIMYEKRQKAEI